MEDNTEYPLLHSFKLNTNKKCLAKYHNMKNILCLCCETNKFPALWLELRKQKKFCDGIILLSSGNQIKVHRIVLSACSSYFKASFTYNNSSLSTSQLLMSPSSSDNKINVNNINLNNNNNNNNKTNDETIIINIDVNDEIMEYILDYAYTGNCNINWLNVEELLAASDRYEVIGLIRLCCQFLLKEISYDNCIGIYLYAKHYFCKELEKYARHYLLSNFSIIINKCDNGELKELDSNELYSLLSDEQLNVNHEEIVFDAIKQWTESDLLNRIKYLTKLLPCIRFGLIRQENFKEHIMIKWPLIKEHLDPEKLLLPLSCRPRIPNQIIFVIGGWTQGSPTNLIEVYDTRADLWLNMKYKDATRAYHGVCTIDHKVYIIGGFDGFTHYNSMRCYDPIKYKWEEKACMYHPRCYVSVAVLGRKIYALGGYNGHTRLDSVERYDTDRNQWEMLSPMKRLRSDAAAVALGENIYVVGGFNGIEVLSSCEMYNPLTDCWTFIPSMLSPRSGVGLVVCDDYLYAIGGFSGEERFDSVERCSPKDPQWRYVANMMVPRSNFATVVVEGIIFVIGGFNGSHTISFVERYDPNTNNWRAATQMNYSRSAQSACVIKDLPNIKAYSLQCLDMLSNESPCCLKTDNPTDCNSNNNNNNNNNDYTMDDVVVVEDEENNNEFHNNNNINFAGNEDDFDHLFWEHGAPEPFLDHFYNQ